jgi:hypothetical protein
MSNHTPGPWDLEPIPYPEDGDDGWYLHRADQEPIFISSDEVSPEDARLIAAAPELLAALKNGADYLDELCGLIQSGMFDAASDWVGANAVSTDSELRAAIAKATQP